MKNDFPNSMHVILGLQKLEMHSIASHFDFFITSSASGTCTVPTVGLEALQAS